MGDLREAKRETLLTDLRQFEHKPLGSIRIDMDDVRAVLAMQAEIERLTRELAEAREDAERWRALMSSERMHFMGSAGFDYTFEDDSQRKSKLVDAVPRQGTYQHFGMEFWSTHPEHGGDGFERKLLTAYADHLRALAQQEGQAG